MLFSNDLDRVGTKLREYKNQLEKRPNSQVIIELLKAANTFLINMTPIGKESLLKVDENDLSQNFQEITNALIKAEDIIKSTQDSELQEILNLCCQQIEDQLNELEGKTNHNRVANPIALLPNYHELAQKWRDHFSLRKR